MWKQTSLNRGRVLCASLSMLFIIGGAWAKDAPGTVKMTLSMSSQGYTFGTIQITRVSVTHEGIPVVKDQTVTTLQLGDQGEISSTSDEVAWIGAKGLVKYDATFEENGEKSLLKARWVDGVLAVQARLDEGDEWTGVEFGKADFDFTTPEMLPLKPVLAAGGKATVKWLNFYEMATAPVTIEYQGKDKRKVGNRSFECDVIVFNNPQMGLSGKIWIATDAHGPFLLREEGRSPDGPFIMQVTDYQKL